MHQDQERPMSVAVSPSPKLQPRHLQLRAIVYVRQSTPRQLLENQESTRRQYQLVERARQLGWPAPQVQVIDDDLGLSGASSHQRSGFQRLVAAIGLGEVGMILVTEVSRLSRRNSDWHRVIELCAVFRTLIADEDGVYDAQDPNDRLLLGVKGTLFAAELHILRARMRGNLLNKARRGELALRLPVGYRRLGDSSVVLDPEEEVRQMLARIFERFSVLRNARAVQRELNEQRLRMPRLIQLGAEAGKLAWVRPTYQMIQQVLTSPVYAGVFVYGRRKLEITPGDPPTMNERRRPIEEWDIVVPGVYPAYLTYDQYLSNRQQLRDNMYNFAKKGRGAPREGLALLQGLMLCGRCGRRMTVSHGTAYRRYECRRAQVDYAASLCQSFPVRHLDAAVEAVLLKAMQPAALETTLQAFAVLDRERRALERHWQLRIERARYEADRAQRQYDAVEPENRSVARTLEARWNTALQALEKLQNEYAVMQRTELRPLDDADGNSVRRLAADLPALWHAATTTATDRKRMLRLVVTEVTLTAHPEQRQATFSLVWCGGTITEHTAICPPLGQHGRTDTAVLDRLTELAGQLPDHQVADWLNAEGFRTRTGKAWTYARVLSMRKQHAIPTGCRLDPNLTTSRADGLVSSRAAAERLQVSRALINLWVRHGVLRHDQRVPSSKVWVRLDDLDIARLTGAAPEAAALPTFKSVLQRTGLVPNELWQRVTEGHYLPYRVRRGRTWQWHLKDLRITSPEHRHLRSSSPQRKRSL
jgi:DNA invertase Pin-like site-specific DNA recombinase